MHCFITGGAGFIGSHLADKLLALGHTVCVFDNFSTGQKAFIQHNLDNPAYRFITGDVLDIELLQDAMQGADIVFHFQANADVRGGIHNTHVDLQQNTLCTHQVLESMRRLGIKKIAFASSATVYGEPDIFPTPEDAHAKQTSLYGASKAASEDLIEAFCEYYDMQGFIFRFVSFVGPRYTHGVVFDFSKKLIQNPQSLEILGDGNQRKSYLDVEDGVNAIMTAINQATSKVNIFNLGNKEYLNVTDLAEIVIREWELKDVRIHYTGGKRGWLGDSPFVHLDVSRIMNLGWKPAYSIEQGIVRTVNYLKSNQELLRTRS